MRNIRKILAGFLVIFASGLVATPLAQAQNNESGSAAKKPQIVQKFSGGEVDWGNQMIYATGEGAMPPATEEPNRAKAYLKAKSYARMQAIAHLMMVVQGTRISFEAIGKDYVAEETIRQQIEGSIRGVEILEDSIKNIQGGSIVVVKVGVPMFGQGNPGAILLEKEIQNQRAADAPKPSPVKVVLPKVAPAPRPIPEKGGAYTSVIIDTRGLNISRAISPKIRRKDGSEVWGTMRVDPDYAIETGIVSYVRSLDDARRNRRCGENPLVIRAIGRGDRAAACDPVISEEDAKRLLSENGNTKFMDKCNVIFLVDPNN